MIVVAVPREHVEDVRAVDVGRRGARALPAAALARALLADLGGTRRDVEEALNDCNQKLSMFGL